MRTSKECPVCSSNMSFLFKDIILKKHEVSYYQCTKCQFACTEDPYWLEEAYESPISSLDIGILARNIALSVYTTNILSTFIKKNDLCLDFAGGFGIFTRIMRDNGFNFKWTDKYTENLFAKSFEMKQDEKPKIITAFEVIEHLPYPKDLFNEFKTINKKAVIILSTETFNSFSKEWWYRTPETGQHVSFFSGKTLKYIAKEYQLDYLKIKNLHIFSSAKITLQRRLLFRVLITPILRNVIYEIIKKTRFSFTNEDYNSVKDNISPTIGITP